MTDRPYLDFSSHVRDVVPQGLRRAEPRAHSPFSATEAAPPAVPSRNPDAFAILRIVAEAYGVTVDDLGEGELVANAAVDLIGQIKTNIRSNINARR